MLSLALFFIFNFFIFFYIFFINLIDSCRIVNALAGSRNSHAVDSSSRQVSKPNLILLIIIVIIMMLVKGTKKCPFSRPLLLTILDAGVWRLPLGTGCHKKKG